MRDLRIGTDRADRSNVIVRYPCRSAIAAGTRYFRTDREARTMTQEGEVRIPLVEERLAVGTRTVDLGDVEVRKTVVTEQVMVPVELRHEVVEYRLIDDPGGVATIGEASGDLKDDTIRIPVFRETPVVHKEIVVTSEIVIDRTLATERQTLEGKLRRATVTVNDNTAPWEPVRRNRNLGEEDNEEATQ